MKHMHAVRNCYNKNQDCKNQDMNWMYNVSATIIYAGVETK